MMFFFFKQKTAYEMRISDWSSDVCSSDLAADIIALAICETGALSERRLAMLTDASLSGLPPFLTDDPGLNSGFMSGQIAAAAMVAETRQKAHPASVDSVPTVVNFEDHV